MALLLGPLLQLGPMQSFMCRFAAVLCVAEHTISHSNEARVLIWKRDVLCRCEKCNHLIGTGVRFNAEKKQIGNYHTTKIWSFTMRAPCCQNRIEIHTDPKNTRYNIVSGARQKVRACQVLSMSFASRRSTAVGCGRGSGM